MLKSIEINNLRGIETGRLDDLAALTILVGANGCGKSTVLDAIAIGTQPDRGSAIKDAIDRRPSVGRGARWLIRRGVMNVNSYVTATCDNNVLQHTYIAAPTHDQISWQAKDSTDKLLMSGHAGAGNRITLDGIDEVRFLDSRLDQAKSLLTDLHSKVVEVGLETEAHDSLLQLIPESRGFRILTDNGNPVLHMLLDEGSIPVGLAGDGVQMVLRMTLELLTAPGGLALLEEPEAHLHPGAILKAAEVIWTAVRRGTQVILSTHSLELIDALVAAAKDDAELDHMAVYQLALIAGELKSARTCGTDVAFVRSRIEDDLR